MAISDSDIKKLWGLSAGRCSYPGCSTPCIDHIEDCPTVIGEMAHVIAKRHQGPRAIDSGGDDSYDNLILLCPTHHTLIDKAHNKFTKQILIKMKCDHEKSISDALSVPHFDTVDEVLQYIQKLLVENKTAWLIYGPESDEAMANPLSNLADLWAFRKLDTIVPNNQRITNVIMENKNLFDIESYQAACMFIEHARGFEQNCYRRTEGIARFPREFERMVRAYGESQ